MNLILVSVLTIFLGGAYGGTVSGILRDTSYTIEWPGGRKANMGFIGDALVGGAAAISVFAIAGSILNIDLTKLNEASQFIKVLAIAIVSGFGGISILQNLSHNLMQKIEKVGQKVEKVDQEIENLKLQEHSNLIRTANFLVKEKKYEEAFINYDQALTIYPENTEPLIGKAAVLKRMGKLDEAYDIVNQIIVRDPNNQKAWHNRACYRCLLNHDKADILRDLRKAISLFPQYKIMATKDQDFEALIGDSEFANLTKD